MLRSIRALSTMSRDPAFHHFLNECSHTVGVSAPASVSQRYIKAAISLFEDDQTVPFIARYRSEATGNLASSDLYELQRKWDDFQSMAKQRDSRIALLDSSGRLTEDIRKAFHECTSKEELDELYSAFKESKTAKSTVIASYGVEEVAHDFVENKIKHTNITTAAAEVAKSSKYSVAEAIMYHCSNHIFSDLDVKAAAKDQFTRLPTTVNTAPTPAYKTLMKDLEKVKNGEKNSSKDKVASSTGSGVVTTGDTKAKTSELSKYRDYLDVHRRISQLSAHQLLAIRRGKEAGVLNVSLSPDENAKNALQRFINGKYRINHPSAAAGTHDPSVVLKLSLPGSKIGRDDVMALACKEAVNKFGASSTKKQWKDAMTAAEIQAAEVFSTSLRPLLLTAPLRLVVDNVRSRMLRKDKSAPIVVCALDPGFAHGHKWVILSQGSGEGEERHTGCVDAKGEDTVILRYGKIFERKGAAEVSAAAGSLSKANPVMLSTPAQLRELLRQFQVDVVAIGNGTASREAQRFVASALEGVKSPIVANTSTASKKKRKHDSTGQEVVDNPFSHGSACGTCLGYVVVSEAGASVYSASERAQQEFPTDVLDIAYVGAVSIGRRLIDPLSELVKVQPASLGVGMYQHDLTDKGISDRLRNVVEDCVNTVGIDINTASSDLLNYVSGLSTANVREIIAYRTGVAVCSAGKAKKSGGGRISCLQDLKSIKGIGAKTFRNCAGFMRVYNGPEPLDVTNVHPDDYDIARLMLQYASEHGGSKIEVSESSEPAPKRKKKGIAEDSSVVGDSDVGQGSMWAKFSAGSHVSSKTAKYAKLKAKSVAELEQIWGWLVDAGLTSGSSATSITTTTAATSPFMSTPKLLQCVPEDFNVQIKVGSEVKGVVRNVTTFGAFVDLGGAEIDDSSDSTGKSKGKAVSKDGLLHCSKYKDYLRRSGNHGRTADLTAIAKEIYVGREVKVRIISIGEAEAGGKKGHDNRRISLDLIELL